MDVVQGLRVAVSSPSISKTEHSFACRETSVAAQVEPWRVMDVRAWSRISDGVTTDCCAQLSRPYRIFRVYRHVQTS
jgi:hypothetical protein